MVTVITVFTHIFLNPCRLVLWSGLDSGSVVLFDSDHGGQIPFEGVISEGPAVRIQFISEQPSYNTGFNIRYEGMESSLVEVAIILQGFTVVFCLAVDLTR